MLSPSQQKFIEAHYETALAEARRYGQDEELSGWAVDGLLNAAVSENPATVRACVRNAIFSGLRRRRCLSVVPLAAEPTAPETCYVDVCDAIQAAAGNDAPLATAVLLHGATLRETGLPLATAHRVVERCRKRLREVYAA